LPRSENPVRYKRECDIGKKNYIRQYLIYVKKEFPGGFKTWVLVGAYKNKDIAEISFNKMLAAGMPVRIIKPWESIKDNRGV
jgi:hypothetical protein